MTAAAYITTTCPKCEGRGILEHYGSVDNGRCHQCWTAGTIRIPAARAAAGEAVALERLRRAYRQIKNGLPATDDDLWVEIGIVLPRLPAAKRDEARAAFAALPGTEDLLRCIWR